MTQRAPERPCAAVRLLGGVSVWLDGEPADLGGERVRALLVLLALAAGDSLSTAVLAERLWGNEPPANIAPSLHTLMTRLRRAVGPGLVATSPAGYSLRITPDQVDALRFSQVLRTAAQQTDPEQEHAAIVEALSLWTGLPFEGVRSEWLETAEAPRLLEQYLGAVERRVDLGVDDRQYGEMLAELRELTATYPLRESLWVRLIRLLAQTGRVAEALDLYESVRLRIADELGVDPGAELRALHAQLLGEREQRPRVPRQLPADLTSFTGRRAALDTLDGVLAEGTCDQAAVIVAIDGTGGTGKTSLAVHWAHAVRDRFPDGQLYVNLRGYSAGGMVPPDLALESLLLGLGVPSDQIPVALEARSAMLRTALADKEVLLVLDNARNVAQVRPLLPGAGGFVIVTSRNQLRGLVAREGARRLSLGRMSAEESTALLAKLVAERPNDVDELEAFAELCGRLPLALVIAAERAGRSRGTDIGSIVRQLSETGDRLAALELGDDELSSVRAVLSWSYQALAPDAARLFRLLGHYPGAVFGPPAAAALAAVDEVHAERLLDLLVEANLVEQEGVGTYQLHDLLRLYAAGVGADDNESEAARARLLDWLAHSAEAARLVRGGRQRFGLLREPLPGVRVMCFEQDADALAWFDREWSTLLAAVSMGAEYGHDRLAACLASALWDYLDQQRSPDCQTITAWQTAVQSAARTGDVLLEAVVSNQLGIIYGLLGRFPESRDQFLGAQDLFDAIGNDYGTAMVLDNLGITYKRLGLPEESIATLLASLDLDPDDRALGAAHNNLASTYSDLGRYDEAIASARIAVELQRKTGYQRGLAYALDSLGVAYYGKGDFDQAIANLEDSAQLCRELHLGAAEVPTLVSLGEAYHAAGRTCAAESAWRRALAAADRQGPSQQFDRDEILELLGSVNTGTATALTDDAV